MLQFDPPSSLTSAQVLSLVLATFIGTSGVAGLLALWFRRKHGPAEVRKLDAEARSIVVRDDLAVGDTLLKLIKEVSQAAAEVREMRKERDEQSERAGQWERRTEQVLEQLSECQDEVKAAREEFKQLLTRYKKKDHELKVAMRILAEHKISYSEGDALKNLTMTKPVLD